MTALEYMTKQASKHSASLMRESLRGASDEILTNIQAKIDHYNAAVEALKKMEG